jgi:Endoribonuclease XendoU
VPASKPEFKALLQKIWFTLYRRRGQPDTSGFEHVFVGEYKGDSPTDNAEGFHNWVQLATQEAAGKTNYKFWKGQAEVNFLSLFCEKLLPTIFPKNHFFLSRISMGCSFPGTVI